MQQGPQGPSGHALAIKTTMEGNDMSVLTIIEELWHKVEGVTQEDLARLEAEAKAEMEKLKADVQGAVADAKAVVAADIEKYGPEVKQAVVAAVSAVEQAVQNILASHM